MMSYRRTRDSKPLCKLTRPAQVPPSSELPPDHLDSTLPPPIPISRHPPDYLEHLGTLSETPALPQECASSVVPSSFLLSIRQTCFNLRLSFFRDDDPKSFLSLFARQTQAAIDPCAIGPLSFDSLRPSHVDAISRLGRNRPERIKLSGESAFQFQGIAGVAQLLPFMGRNRWVEWSTTGSTWIVLIGFEELAGPLFKGARDSIEDEIVKGIDFLNLRNRGLKHATQRAATALLKAARPLPSFTSQPTQSTNPSHNHSTNSARLLDSKISTSTPGSGPQPSLQSPSISPIFSLPYEVLDTILSHLSPGGLSSKQHRLVMNWAQDRSTLTVNKVDSRTEFLRKTNCWRWESERYWRNRGYREKRKDA